MEPEAGGQGAPAATQPPADVPADWLSQVQAKIMRSEYNLSLQKNPFGGETQAWQAPNRAMGWRVWFLPEGLRVVERTNSPSRIDWRVELKGYGWNGDVQPVKQAALRTDGNRMTYERAGVLESYENTPEGLKQGVVLHAPPPRTDFTHPESRIVKLVFSLPGNVKARVGANGTSVDLVMPDGESLVTLGNYRATDAAGRELAVSIAGGGDEMAL
jgi:hypothetical protein